MRLQILSSNFTVPDSYKNIPAGQGPRPNFSKRRYFVLVKIFCQTSTMERFVKIVNAKRSISDVWHGSEYASATCTATSQSTISFRIKNTKT